MEIGKYILNNFILRNERESIETVTESIVNNVVFKGTNLWILICAIFIASLGLNVNSIALLIGAMLISPLIGPIMGIGFGMAINDLALIKKASFNYLFSICIGLIASTVFFLFSPIHENHSEILARTSPDVADVLIAFFGGLAGIIATASKHKGNVIPGVAIATALMPPLCTAGFGLATLQLNFVFGALYLLLINSVFIALATLLISRFLRFPKKSHQDEAFEKRSNRIVWGIVIVTILPSVYFGYDILQQNKFTNKANKFIDIGAVFPNNYLMKKEIDPKNHVIKLTYLGAEIESKDIESLKQKLVKFDLPDAKLEIKQGYTSFGDKKETVQTDFYTKSLMERDKQIQLLKSSLDSLQLHQTYGSQFFKELKIQYPNIQSLVIQPVVYHSESARVTKWISIIYFSGILEETDKQKIEKWIQIRVNSKKVVVFYDEIKNI